MRVQQTTKHKYMPSHISSGHKCAVQGENKNTTLCNRSSRHLQLLLNETFVFVCFSNNAEHIYLMAKSNNQSQQRIINIKAFIVLIKMKVQSRYREVSYPVYHNIHTQCRGLRAQRKLLLGLRRNRALRRWKVGGIERVSFRTEALRDE